MVHDISNILCTLLVIYFNDFWRAIGTFTWSVIIFLKIWKFYLQLNFQYKVRLKIYEMSQYSKLFKFTILSWGNTNLEYSIDNRIQNSINSKREMLLKSIFSPSLSGLNNTLITLINWSRQNEIIISSRKCTKECRDK